MKGKKRNKEDYDKEEVREKMTTKKKKMHEK